jgi:hypothetical protein
MQHPPTWMGSILSAAAMPNTSGASQRPWLHFVQANGPPCQRRDRPSARRRARTASVSSARRIRRVGRGIASVLGLRFRTHAPTLPRRAGNAREILGDFSGILSTLHRKPAPTDPICKYRVAVREGRAVVMEGWTKPRWLDYLRERAANVDPYNASEAAFLARWASLLSSGPEAG